MPEPLRRAAIVLCGGHSSRMGMPKAWLPFGAELMLPRVLRLLGDVVTMRLVVAAPPQELPELPSDVQVIRDEREGRGPLEGIYAGLKAAAEVTDAAYITACDVPLLVPDFVRRMFAELGEHEVCVPREDRYYHPLAAVYRIRILPAIEQLLAEDQLRMSALFDRVATKNVHVDSLRDVDPDLLTLRNLNRPEDYLAAVRDAGFQVPTDVAARLQRE